MDRSVAVRVSLDPSGLMSGLSAAGAAVSSFAAKTKAAADGAVGSLESKSRVAAASLIATSQAHMQVEAAAAKASSSLVANGRGLDLATEKGRANRAALNELAVAGQKYADTLSAQGKPTAEQAAHLTRMRDQYVSTAVAMGESRQAAEAVAGSFGRTEGVLSRSLSSVERNSAAWSQLGSTLTTVGAVGAAGLGLMAKSAMDWEQQFTGVVKTTGVTGAAMNRLEGDLRGMAKTMPATHKEIAGVAEAAGQLGVKTKDIAGFTRTMVMMGAATNLSSEEAATGIAQLMNIMGTVPQDVGRVAATIVALGNAGASTEKQILDMGQRISGAGNQVKMSEDQVLAYANALASVGINAEAGGTAMSKVFIKLDQASRESGDKLQTLNRIAGTDFKRAFQQDAAGATHELVKGLGKLQASGGDVAGALDEMGIKGQYERDAMMRLAGATLEAGAAQDVLGDSLRTGAEAWSQNTALLDEYGRFANTTQAKAKIAWNNIKDSVISAGTAMLPAISAVSEAVAKFADKLGKMSPEQLKFGVTAAAIVTAAALITGGVIKAVVGLAELKGALVAIGATNAAAGLGKAGQAILSIGRFAAPAAIAIGAMMVIEEVGNKAKWAAPNIDAVSRAIERAAKSGEGMKPIDEMFQFRTFDPSVTAFKIDGLAASFDRLQHATTADSIARWWDTNIGVGDKSQITQITESLGAFDTQLTKLNETGRGGQAQAVFRQIAEQAQKAGVPVGDLANKYFPQYAQSLRNVADQAGYTIASEQELVEWMGGKTPEAIQKAAQASPEVSRALGEVGKSAKSAAEEMEDTVKAAQTLGNELLALSGSQIGVEAAIDSATKALKENGRTLDLDTEKGRANKQALLDLGGASMKYIENLAKQGRSQEEQRAATAKARGEWERLAKAMSMSEKDIRNNADAFFALVAPAEQAAEATKKTSQAVAGAGGELRKLPPNTKVGISVDGIRDFAGTLDEVAAQIKDLPRSRIIHVTLPNGERVLKTVGEVRAEIELAKKGAEIPISTPGADQAKSKIQDVATELGEIPPDKKVVVSAPLIGNVATDIQGIIKQLDTLRPETPVTVTLPNGDKIIGTAGEIREAVKYIPDSKPVDIPATTNAPAVAGEAQRSMDGVRPPGTLMINVGTNAAQIALEFGQTMENVKSTAAMKTSEVEGTLAGWRDRMGGIFGDLRGRATSSWNGLWADASGTGAVRRGEIEGGTSGWRDRMSGIVSDLRGRVTSSWNGLWADARQTGDSRRGEIEGGTSGWRNRMGGIFGDLRGRVSDTWSGMWGNLRSTGDSMMAGIRGGIDSALRGIQGAFSHAVEAIGRAWGGLRSKAADPVRFIINTVYRDGIKAGFDKIAGLFNMSGLPEIRANFARGGIMPGYTPGRDIYDFYDPKHNIRLGLSGGEPIMRPEVGKLLGENGVNTINEAARTGGQRGAAKALAGILGHLHFAQGGTFPEHQAFARGGVFGGSGHWTPVFEAAVRAAAALAGQVFNVAQRGFRPATSYSGTSHAGDAIDVMPSGSWLGAVAALRTMGIPSWDRTGKGNWAPHIHGVPLPGFGLAGGSGIYQAMDYLRGGDGLGGRDNGPRIMPGGLSADAIQALAALAPMDGGGFNIRGLFSDSLSKAKQVATSPWGTAMSKIPGLIVDGVVKKAESIIPGFARGTSSAPAGWSWVGEEGPELMHLRGGEAILSHTDSLRMTRRANEDALQALRSLHGVVVETAEAMRGLNWSLKDQIDQQVAKAPSGAAGRLPETVKSLGPEFYWRDDKIAGIYRDLLAKGTAAQAERVIRDAMDGLGYSAAASDMEVWEDDPIIKRLFGRIRQYEGRAPWEGSKAWTGPDQVIAGITQPARTQPYATFAQPVNHAAISDAVAAAIGEAVGGLRPVVQIGGREFYGVMQDANRQYGRA